jgi:hypothetical protein
MFAFVVIYRCTLVDSVLCVVSSKRFAELVIRVTATEDDTQAQRITDSDGNGGWRFKCVSIGCNNRGAERASTKVVAVWDACMALVRDMCACDLLTQMISGMLEYRRRLTGFVQSLADASTLVARNVTGGLAVLPTLAPGLSWVPTQQQHVPPPPQALQRYMGNFGLTTLMV